MIQIYCEMNQGDEGIENVFGRVHGQPCRQTQSDVYPKRPNVMTITIVFGGKLTKRLYRPAPWFMTFEVLRSQLCTRHCEPHGIR